MAEEPNWAPAWDALEPNVPRVIFELARKPERGQHVQGDVYAVSTRPWPDAPSVVIYYRFDEERVYLISAERGGEYDDVPL